jgi:stage V sporulation protein SpoVS
MSTFYELIGRAVIGFVRRRYRRELQAAGAIAAGIAAVGIAAYVAGRDGDDEA